MFLRNGEIREIQRQEETKEWISWTNKGSVIHTFSPKKKRLRLYESSKHFVFPHYSQLGLAEGRRARAGVFLLSIFFLSSRVELEYLSLPLFLSEVVCSAVRLPCFLVAVVFVSSVCYWTCGLDGGEGREKGGRVFACCTFCHHHEYGKRKNKTERWLLERLSRAWASNHGNDEFERVFLSFSIKKVGRLYALTTPFYGKSIRG